ncbi:MAG TPA: MarR family transcriptional regulator [Candidatus Sulfotelmatobacter sp.]|nr:MarR family transcriptional regulator [Candidatus Sulfotelmatobacter sp.]
MNRDEVAAATEAIQRYYPQIFLACHVAHVRAASTPYRLSDRDSSLLAHLDPEHPITPTKLARHMGVGRPALSATIRRLSQLGYIQRARDPRDRRSAGLTLTALGTKAMSSTSVLDAERVARALQRLRRNERIRAVDGLAILARACREYSVSLKKTSRTRGFE